MFIGLATNRYHAIRAVLVVCATAGSRIYLAPPPGWVLSAVDGVSDLPLDFELYF